MATLGRGAPFLLVSAVSGWAGSRSDPLQLDNKLWTEEAKIFWKATGYFLPAHDRDQGKDSRYYSPMLIDGKWAAESGRFYRRSWALVYHGLE